jgi:hypothetical protein
MWNHAALMPPFTGDAVTGPCSGELGVVSSIQHIIKERVGWSDEIAEESRSFGRHSCRLHSVFWEVVVWDMNC